MGMSGWVLLLTSAHKMVSWLSHECAAKYVQREHQKGSITTCCTQPGPGVVHLITCFARLVEPSCTSCALGSLTASYSLRAAGVGPCLHPAQYINTPQCKGKLQLPHG
jgi:hypothetical protein